MTLTPKEKAEELSNKYWNLNYEWDGVIGKDKWANEGALIAVDEILEVLESIDNPTAVALCYWYHEVKQEIINF